MQNSKERKYITKNYSSLIYSFLFNYLSLSLYRELLSNIKSLRKDKIFRFLRRFSISRVVRFLMCDFCDNGKSIDKNEKEENERGRLVMKE